MAKATVLTLMASFALSQLPLQAMAQAPSADPSVPSTSQPESREARRAARKKKAKLILRKVGRTSGRISTAVAVATARPFMSAVGFLRGFFEREDKNTRSAALLKMLLESGNHERLHELAFSSGNAKDYAAALVEEVGTMLEEKGEYVLKSILHDIQPAIDLDAPIENIDMRTVDLNKLTPELVRANPDFRFFEELVGDLDEDRLVTAVRNGEDIESELPEIELSDYAAALPHGLEAAGAVILQTIIAPSVIGSIASVAGAIYAWPVVLGYAGAGISVWQCMIPKNKERVAKALEGRDAYGADEQEQFENDTDLANFCQKVTNDSLFKLITSRSKGYLAGKKAKKWFRGKFPRNIPPADDASPNAPAIH